MVTGAGRSAFILLNLFLSCDTIERNKFSIPVVGNRKENLHSLPVWALYHGLWCNVAAVQARTPPPPCHGTPAPAPSP